MNREIRKISSIGDWLAWRRGDITASRIGALFGCHPHLSLDRLVAQMRDAASEGDSPAKRRGRILEPAVIAGLAEEHPDWRMEKATSYHCLPDHRLGATPDYWLGDDGLIEVKTVSPARWDEWRGRPPLAYTLQTLTGLLVTGREHGVLAIMVCSPSYPIHCFDVPRHAEAEGRILDAVAAFWRAWDAGDIAVPAPADELAEALDDGSHKDLSRDNIMPALLAERAGLKAAVTTAERRLGEIDHQIKTRIGKARTAYVPGWSISFSTQRRAERVVPAREYRVLRIKEMSEEVE